MEAITKARTGECGSPPENSILEAGEKEALQRACWPWRTPTGSLLFQLFRSLTSSREVLRYGLEQVASCDKQKGNKSCKTVVSSRLGGREPDKKALREKGRPQLEILLSSLLNKALQNSSLK